MEAGRPSAGADDDGAELDGAELDGAELKGAELKGAELKGAELKGAELEGAELEGAGLDGFVLDEPLLEGVVVDGAALEAAELGGRREVDDPEDALIDGPLEPGTVFETVTVVGSASPVEVQDASTTVAVSVAITAWILVRVRIGSSSCVRCTAAAFGVVCALGRLSCFRRWSGSTRSPGFRFTGPNVREDVRGSRRLRSHWFWAPMRDTSPRYRGTRGRARRRRTVISTVPTDAAVAAVRRGGASPTDTPGNHRVARPGSNERRTNHDGHCLHGDRGRR
ncbi:pentapeptide repeat-containing protein [Nakamurella sp. A5-74]|uniref:Pentapeptide repeat-containing protein n=1 Tax=Nakamurella sp. A5-74 TaxID=3158264 RepID=A0AAU8DQA2_9ACTN